jgi:hypothetical protein
MSLDLISRANVANNGAIKLNNNTATVNNITTPTSTPTATTTNRIVDEIKNYNKRGTKRINVSFSEEIFDKLITVANGKSVSKVMENILIDAVRDCEINEEVVRIYKDTMKKKGKKSNSNTSDKE